MIFVVTFLRPCLISFFDFYLTVLYLLLLFFGVRVVIYIFFYFFTCFLTVLIKYFLTCLFDWFFFVFFTLTYPLTFLTLMTFFYIRLSWLTNDRFFDHINDLTAQRLLGPRPAWELMDLSESVLKRVATAFWRGEPRHISLQKTGSSKPYRTEELWIFLCLWSSPVVLFLWRTQKRSEAWSGKQTQVGGTRGAQRAARTEFRSLLHQPRSVLRNCANVTNMVARPRTQKRLVVGAVTALAAGAPGSRSAASLCWLQIQSQRLRAKVSSLFVGTSLQNQRRPTPFC